MVGSVPISATFNENDVSPKTTRSSTFPKQLHLYMSLHLPKHVLHAIFVLLVLRHKASRMANMRPGECDKCSLFCELLSLL